MTTRPRLATPLTLEAPDHRDDGAGGVAEGWIPVATLWGAVRAVAASEKSRGGSIVSSVTHRITLRAVPRESALWPSNAHRLRLGRRLFHIAGVTESGDLLLTIWAREDAAP